MKRKRGYDNQYGPRRLDIDDPRSHGGRHYDRPGPGRGYYRGGGGYNRGRGGYYNNRPPPPRNYDPVDRENERRSRIRQLLVRIGERSSSTLAHNLDQLSTALLVDIENYRKFIVATLFECVVHLAVKIPIYATLVGLINHAKEDFGAEIVKTLSHELTVSLLPASRVKHGVDNNESGNNDAAESAKVSSQIADTCKQRGLTPPVIDLNRIRLLTRFAACLYTTNLIAIGDILDVAEFLLRHGLEDALPYTVREHMAYVVLSMLMWCANGNLLRDELADKAVAERVQALTQTLDAFISARPHTVNASAFQPFKDKQVDFVGDAWKAFTSKFAQCREAAVKAGAGNGEAPPSDEKVEEKKELAMDTDAPAAATADSAPDATNPQSTAGAAAGTAQGGAGVFVIKSIHAPHREFSRLKKRFRHELKLSLEECGVASWVPLQLSGVQPMWIEFGIARLLDRTAEAAAKEEPLERVVVTDYIHDILLYFNQDTKLCAEQLMQLPSSFEAKYCIVEGLIFAMMRLPHAQHHFIFYGKIIIELFRKQTKVWPRVVGPAINCLFHSLARLDIECRDRLVEWFSFHLANFNFQWPWENWSSALVFPVSSPKTSFIRAVMSKCVHLSYYERFKKTLPADIISIVPHKPEGAYKYALNDTAVKLLVKLNQRESPEDIANHLETFIEPMKRDADAAEPLKAKPKSLAELTSFAEMSACDLSESEDVVLRQLELLFVCTLHVGKSSCTHLLSCLKMYGKKPLKALLAATPCEFGALVLLKELFAYWQHSPVRIEILADKLHASNYVSPLAVVKFVFLKENVPQLHRHVFWLMVTQAIDRIVKTTQGMQRGIDKFGADLVELEKSLCSDFNDSEMTLMAKRNKEKQLAQLTQRLQATRDKIAAVLLLFFRECVKCMGALLDEAEREKEEEGKDGGDKAKEEENKEDGDGDEEMDDDLLMSEQFIHKQEKRDKEKEQMALRKSRESNVSQYLFDIVQGRMVEMARKFFAWIDEPVWQALEEDVFKDVKHDKIRESIKHIQDMKELLNI